LAYVTFCVGFDLDMTLVDSRSGIAEVMTRLAAETGAAIDVDAVVNRLGPPLELELANWFPADRVPAMAQRYRELYADAGVRGAHPMPGALATLDAVHALGGRAVVVTAKSEPHGRAIVERLGFRIDAVAGGRFGSAKGAALRENDAEIYVGDHLGDIDAARAADAVAVSVATGMYDVTALRMGGADTVLDDLTGFPEWLAENRREVA
jgi:phosphoglycolate phosphatase